MTANLFEDSGAVFNDARTHRQALWRGWENNGMTLVVIGMNPSKADETDNDPTVERCVRRAHQLGYGGLMMLNMQDVIETDSRKLDQMTSDQRCTSANVEQLLIALDMAKDGLADVLCAWGKPGQKYGPVAWLTTQAARRRVTLFCLKKNKDGSPVHPLYQPYSKEFEWFAGVDAKDAALPLPVRKDEWDSAPIGTLAPAFRGGAWMKTRQGWQWNGHREHSGSTFGRPGGDWTGELIYPDQQKTRRKSG